MPLLLLLALLPPEVEPPDPRPTFQVQLQRKDDRLEVVHRKSEVVWRIISRTGIGRAEIALTGGEPPRVLHVEFTNLHNLESFRLDDGRGPMEGRLDRERGRSTWYFDDRGRPTDRPAKEGAALTVERLPAGGVRAVFTTARPTRKWSLAWINEYRR